MLAYFDGLRGLVPVKVIYAKTMPGGLTIVHGRVTVDASARGYPRGEVIESTGVRMIPRDKVRRLRSRTSTPRILPYSWAGIAIGEG
jgi:hypothetical protein